jgi:hypothetical protein
MVRKGIDNPSITLDGHTFGGALEPSVRRGGQSVTGRTSRMVLA